MICAHCHTEFDYHRKRKYCSKECCLDAQKKPIIELLERKCAYKNCDKTFTPKHSSRIYCSDTCRTYVAHGKNTIPGWRERQRIKNAPRCKIWVATCQYTGRLFIARTPKQTKHPDYIVPYQPIPKETYTCLNCDTEFTRRKKPDDVLPLCRACSDKESRRTAKHKRRARLRGAVRDHIVPLRVFLRDNWTCQICGVWTPRELRGTIHECAPEIDHKIPLCKGGLHSYANVHCTCRRCNCDKGDKIVVKYITQLIDNQIGRVPQ